MAEKIFARVDENGYIEVRHQKPEKPAATPGTRWIDDIPPAYDPATHWLEEKTPIPANAKKVPYKIVARDPAAEAEAAQIQADEVLLSAGGDGIKHAACLLVEVTAALLASGAATTDDFSPHAQKVYADLKRCVDKIGG